MKYMIASDIHGSSYYCQKLMDAYKYEKPFYVFGEILIEKLIKWYWIFHV